MCNRVSNHRSRAFVAQSGRCYYCDFPMWEAEDIGKFCLTYGLTLPQAPWFQCTAEHLEARQDGGGDNRENIVAACKWCNMKRHARKKTLSVARYREWVQKRVRAGRWHPAEVSRKLLKLKPPTTPALRATPPRAGGEFFVLF
jgi:hypothetical protein